MRGVLISPTVHFVLSRHKNTELFPFIQDTLCDLCDLCAFAVHVDPKTKCTRHCDTKLATRS